MAEKYVNKFVYFGETKFDISADTVTPDKLLKNITAHDKSGAPIVGNCTFDSDTTDATIAVAEMLLGKTAYARGTKLTGTMPNVGSQVANISTATGSVTISQGYHDGSGKVKISDAEQAKLIPANIRENVTILGVVGTMSGTEDATPQAKEVTPSNAVQTILPDDGYNYLSQVTVKAVPYSESDNAAGGVTIVVGE